MSEKLTKEAFAENVNTKFRIATEPARTLELDLIEVVSTLSTPRQEQFSLFFRGPLDLFLPQSIYHMEHDSMGGLEMFIVPVGRAEDGFRYEAVFNYVLQGG